MCYNSSIKKRSDIMKKGKIAIATAALMSSIVLIKPEHTYNPQYEIINEDAFATYEDGLVYIGDENYIISLTNVHENDILVVDDRKTESNSIKIVSSYKIDDKDVRNDIICIIDEYVKMNPDTFDRTIESMRVEWFVHNLLYSLNYEPNRTRDVDYIIN